MRLAASLRSARASPNIQNQISAQSTHFGAANWPEVAGPLCAPPARAQLELAGERANFNWRRRAGGRRVELRVEPPSASGGRCSLAVPGERFASRPADRGPDRSRARVWPQTSQLPPLPCHLARPYRSRRRPNSAAPMSPRPPPEAALPGGGRACSCASNQDPSSWAPTSRLRERTNERTNETNELNEWIRSIESQIRILQLRLTTNRRLQLTMVCFRLARNGISMSAPNRSI